MSRFHKFVDEKCMGAYTSKADNKKKRKRKGKMDEAKLMPEVSKARKVKGKKLNDIMDKLYNQSYETLYNLDIVLADSFGKAESKGIRDARIMVQKALKELGFLTWASAMDNAFPKK